MKKKKRKGKLILFIFVLILALVLVYFALNMNKKDDTKPVKKVVDEIKNFDYTVAETDSKLFKTEFKNLKKVLSKDEVDNKEYAQAVAKLFVIDFFSLNNKLSKNDVGGVQFVYSNYKASFIDKARDEFYKYVKSNLNSDRNQELPMVETIDVESCEQVSASSELSGDEFSSISEAYKVNLKWTYDKDLGYQTSATVIVVKENDKFSVAKLN